MSHSTLHGFHYPGVIQSYKWAEALIQEAVGKFFSHFILQAHKRIHFFSPGGFTRCFADQEHCGVLVLFSGPNHPNMNRTNTLSVAPLVTFVNTDEVFPRLSASLLLLLSALVVGVHLRGFLSLRWKDEQMGRKQRAKGNVQVLIPMNNT